VSFFISATIARRNVIDMFLAVFTPIKNEEGDDDDNDVDDEEDDDEVQLFYTRFAGLAPDLPCFLFFCRSNLVKTRMETFFAIFVM